MQFSKPADFVFKLSERISGLAASQDLLVRGEWKTVDLAELVAVHLAGFSGEIGDRIIIDGLPLGLSPSSAQAIGMALHELATNAAKYGALSNDTGVVEISWQANVGEGFSMSWIEKGGPAVHQPTHFGFGQKVLVNMAQAAVNGAVELDYLQSGVTWRLKAPLADIEA